MFKYVLGAGVAGSRMYNRCATYDLVGLSEFAGVSGIHIGKTEGVFAAANHRRPAVGRGARTEVTGYGESGAGR
eukprot:6173005-Pleurochrysis_carterae.AAC.2